MDNDKQKNMEQFVSNTTNGEHRSFSDILKNGSDWTSKDFLEHPLKLVDKNPMEIDINNVKQKEEPKKESKGMRFDEGKLRYDLLEPFAIEQVVRIFTKGSEKYAPNNWLKGMNWSKVRASAARHQAAFERGEDYDYYPDKCEACRNGDCKNHTGELHAAQAAWNWLALTSYYKHFPEGDDRLHLVLPKKKISLDLDDCIVCWTTEWAKKFGHPIPKNWHFSYKTDDNFKSLNEEEVKDFYLNLPCKVIPESLKFNIHCYITSRSIDENITKAWIEDNGFPTKPVYSVGFGESKVEAFKKSGADYHIDDSYDNFIEMTNAGICCFLLTTPHNNKYTNVGYRRIASFEDFEKRFL